MTFQPSIQDRRGFFCKTGFSLGSAALSSLLHQSSVSAVNRADSNQGNLPARAKSVIYLHMIGAPSQLDLFDPKPELVVHDNEVCPESFLTGRRFAFIGGEMRLAGSRQKFTQHGESGHIISGILPHLSKVADELCIVHSLHTEEINHAPAQIFLHTGFGRGGRPSFGRGGRLCPRRRDGIIAPCPSPLSSLLHACRAAWVVSCWAHCLAGPGRLTR